MKRVNQRKENFFVFLFQRKQYREKSPRKNLKTKNIERNLHEAIFKGDKQVLIKKIEEIERFIQFNFREKKKPKLRSINDIL